MLFLAVVAFRSALAKTSRLGKRITGDRPWCEGPIAGTNLFTGDQEKCDAISSEFFRLADGIVGRDILSAGIGQA